MTTRPSPSDADLIWRAQAGDRLAFRQIYERYARQVFAFLLGYLRDPDQAEDLTQETFVRVWQALPKYREQGSFRAWLFRIARRLAIDAVRRQKRHPQAPLWEVRDQHATDPLASLEHQQTVQEVMQALDTLKEEYRTVLVLRFLVGLNVAETAAVLGRSKGAVRVLQHRALQALRRRLKA